MVSTPYMVHWDAWTRISTQEALLMSWIRCVGCRSYIKLACDFTLSPKTVIWSEFNIITKYSVVSLLTFALIKCLLHFNNVQFNKYWSCWDVTVKPHFTHGLINDTRLFPNHCTVDVKDLKAQSLDTSQVWDHLLYCFFWYPFCDQRTDMDSWEKQTCLRIC